MILKERLSQEELAKRISTIELVYRQPSYAGPKQDLDDFLNEIERNCQRVGVPRTQWVDVALHFMTEKIRGIMQECKDHIQNSEKIDNSNLWDEFKLVLRELHGTALSCTRQVLRIPLPPTTTFVKAAAGGIAIAGATYAVGPAVVLGALNVAGFTSSGVLAGSAAATAQSIIYGGSTTGIFSVMQSIAATGVVASAPALAVGAGAVGLAAAGFYLARNISRREN
ncbi:hypothetical protein BT96DRAFT_1019872 [Gymnopus androsaceus JB14]|uniref:Uncharacterized protein n=1 Tax=Gymnopus androsaceus JB14 TaxID=1447944 RepID=A0A6A4HL89_9AGAR|nr:hypothetical protein BT96DRAFT_1019872 [Gymnopus androsaceus JB14]